MKLTEQLCSAPSCSWTELHAYYFQPNYYLTFLSPSDPAPPLFLWGAALPEAHPRTPPCPPVCQQHHPLPPFTKTLKLQNEVISKRLAACDLMHSTGCCEVIRAGPGQGAGPVGSRTSTDQRTRRLQLTSRYPLGIVPETSCVFVKQPAGQYLLRTHRHKHAMNTQKCEPCTNIDTKQSLFTWTLPRGN